MTARAARAWRPASAAWSLLTRLSCWFQNPASVLRPGAGPLGLGVGAVAPPAERRGLAGFARGARHGGHGDGLDEVPREGDVVVPAQPLDARHHVVRALGFDRVEADLAEPADHGIPPLPVLLEERVVEAGRELKGPGDRDLQRVGGAHGQ